MNILHQVQFIRFLFTSWNWYSILKGSHFPFRFYRSLYVMLRLLRINKQRVGTTCCHCHHWGWKLNGRPVTLSVYSIAEWNGQNFMTKVELIQCWTTENQHHYSVQCVLNPIVKQGPRSWNCIRPTWLTHCALVTPYGDKHLGQHWPR